MFTKKLDFYTLLFILTSFLSLFFIDSGDVMIEMVIKLLSLISLSFLYLSRSKKINYWYLLVLLCSIVSDAFLVFDDAFLIIGTLFLLINRVLYIIIARRAFFETEHKTLLLYFLPFFAVFAIVFPQLKSYLGELSYTILIMGLLSTIMALFAFINYLNKMTIKNKFFFLGMLIITIADILIAFNKFIDYKLLYVIFYTILYYIARYLICKAMIVEKN
ncbi:YhhN-like protein [Tenacibaculum adriaticum]|uniref:YhhN-like protein n=1 Tax=Tenacibaculum adriaticum TaxID=413713 RepID=A0A5S5DSB5_9FLAO|nr:lysoplasmalogenase family protein [Tenacibaculum adriaticum]TYP98777.1 YhhN-like protein [Tenacibaculum adriaticum]